MHARVRISQTTYVDFYVKITRVYCSCARVFRKEGTCSLPTYSTEGMARLRLSCKRDNRSSGKGGGGRFNQPVAPDDAPADRTGGFRRRIAVRTTSRTTRKRKGGCAHTIFKHMT